MSQKYKFEILYGAIAPSENKKYLYFELRVSKDDLSSVKNRMPPFGQETIFVYNQIKLISFIFQFMNS